MFVKRCLKTDGVTEEQVKAFHAKLWQLHVDSQRGLTKPKNGTVSSRRQELLSMEYSSSREKKSDGNLHPFKDRIRPGMVVRWRPPADFPLRSEKHNLAVIMCPQNAVGGQVRDILGNLVRQSPLLVHNGDSPSDHSLHSRYLCAMVLPGSLADTYEVSLWRQVVIDVDQMEDEVYLEYDHATRYYHISV